MCRRSCRWLLWHHHHIGQVLLAHKAGGDKALRGSLRLGRVGIFATAQRVKAQFRRLNMRQIMAAEIGDSQLAEHIVKDRRGVLDRVIALHHAGRFELREGESIHEFFQRHAILQAYRDGDGEIVHHRTERSALLVHVDEDFTQLAIFIFASAEIDLMAANGGLLGITLAARGKLFTCMHMFHHPFDNLFNEGFNPRRHGLGHQHIHRIIGFVIIVGQQLRRQRL